MSALDLMIFILISYTGTRKSRVPGRLGLSG
jgi:hypothetical protein